MGRIEKVAGPKHEATISPAVAQFSQKATIVPLPELPTFLATFPRRWPFPRGDLYHWIGVLNRFDEILARIIDKYELNSGPQTTPFGRLVLVEEALSVNTAPTAHECEAKLNELGFGKEGDRELLESILDFSRLLLEKCGNRTLFNSSERLNALLNTASLSLIQSTLRLSLCLAQRYYFRQRSSSSTHFNQSLLASHYNIDLDRVQKMAAPLPALASAGEQPEVPASAKGKEKSSTSTANADECNPNDLISLTKNTHGKDAADDVSPDQWKQWGNIRMSYYPRDARPEGTASGHFQQPPMTPTPSGSRHATFASSRLSRGSMADDSPVPATYSPFNKPNELNSGRRILEIPSSKVLSSSIEELQKEKQEELPQESKYELLNRLRIAQALGTSLETRQQLLSIRLLSITNLAYVYPEAIFQQKILHQDSDEPKRLQLAYQLSEFVHLGVAGDIVASTLNQAFALLCLDALTKHKSRSADVCAALNVNVNHGILMFVIRKTVAELAEEDDSSNSTDGDDWRDALFALLRTLPNTGVRTPETLASAGLIPMFVDILNLRTDKARRVYPRVLEFLDNFVHSVRDALATLATAKGFDALSDLIAFETKSAFDHVAKGEGIIDSYKTPTTDYDIPYFHQQGMRWLFKFVNHVMQHNSGGFERLLRNLIDSPPLLSALRMVLENAKIFGSHVWSGSVNIMSHFIHNEPTSYAVIAEAGLSKTFLEAVMGRPIVDTSAAAGEEEEKSRRAASLFNPANPPSDPETVLAQLSKVPDHKGSDGILPSTEAIVCIPFAFGAICLNSTGLDLFLASDALERFFDIFESPAHVKCMKNDSNLLRLLGNSFDELVRHHPALKTSVMSSVLRMVARVGLLGKHKAWECGLGTKLWVDGADGKLTIAGGPASLLGDIGAPFTQDLEVCQTSSAPSLGDGRFANTYGRVFGEPKVDSWDTSDNDQHRLCVANYIFPVLRFLAAFFENQTICANFIESGGVEYVLDFATLQSLPFDFHNNDANHQLSQVIHLMAETKPHLILPSLVKRTQDAVDKLEEFWGESRENGFFSPLTSVSKTSDESPESLETKAKGTYFAKHLVAVETLTDILREIYTPAIYPTRPTNQPSPFVQANLADKYAKLSRSLGLLHAACVWEEILLQKDMPANWNEATTIAGFPEPQPSEGDANEVPTPVNPETVSEPGGVPSAPTQPLTELATSSGDPGTQSRSQNVTAAGSEKGAAIKNVKTLRYLLSALPSSITGFLHVLGHGLTSKRRMDTYQRQKAAMVAESIAKMVIEQLNLDAPKRTSCRKDQFSYLIVILSSFSQLLFDSTAERPHTHCLTMIFDAFKKLDGLQVMKDLSDLFLTEIKILSPVAQGNPDSQDAPARLASAYGGVKIILTFFSQMTSPRYIIDSSQTQAMASGHSFLPPQFLVELRMEALPLVRGMWSSKFVETASSSIVKSLIEILRMIFEGEYENGAYRYGDDDPTPQPETPRTFTVNRDRLNTLTTDKGYDENLSREALYRCNNVLAAAEEYCAAQKGLRIPPRNSIPSSDAETGAPPRSSARALTSYIENQTQGGSTADPSTSPPFDDPIATLLGDIQAAQSGDPSRSNASDEGTAQGDNPFTSQNANRAGDSGDQAREATSAPTKRPELVSVDQLDKERDELRVTLIERCMEVLNTHHDITFELADLIHSATKRDSRNYRQEIGETLMHSLLSLQQDDDFTDGGKKIAAYANLLALVIQDEQFYESLSELLQEQFSAFVSLIKISPSASDKPTEESCPWVGQVLLILERILSDDATPLQIQWNPPNPDSPDKSDEVAEFKDPVVDINGKKDLLDAILEILPRIRKDESLALSICRILSILTRERCVAEKLGEKRNLQRLFVMIKQLANASNDKLQNTFMLVLRHIIEDDDTVRQIMRTEIVSNFESRSPRQTDTATYVRQFYHLILRSPQLFIEVTNEKLKLQRYDAGQRPQALVLKTNEKEKQSEGSKDSSKEEETTEKSELQDTEKQGTDQLGTPASKEKHKELLKTPIVEHPDGVIHYLLSELLSYRDVDDKETHTSPATETAISGSEDVEMAAGGEPSSADPASSGRGISRKRTEKPQFKAEEHPIYIYRCFLLQCLTELLSSYNRTKVEFIKFSRKADPLATTPSKPRSGILNYLLSSLIPIGTLEHDEAIPFKKRVNTSNWAMRVVVALCAKTGEIGGPSKRYATTTSEEEGEPDLMFVRRFVLEHGLKIYKEANASQEPLDTKYARLMCLADLFDKMLSGASASDGTARFPSSTRQVAKTMFEKHFVSAFTASIADIDLNFPSSKRVVKYILRPLNKLTQTAVLLSETSSLSTPGETDDGEISSASSVSDLDDEREETPDLFRHSTLGMFEPQDEEETSEEDEEDAEMYDDEYDEEMEYEEDMPEDDGEVVSEDEDIDGRGPIEGLPGDRGMDIEVLLESGESETESDTEDDDDSEDDDDESGMSALDDRIIGGEITGDNDNDSLREDNEGEWESEVVSGDEDDAEMMNRLENELDDMAQGDHRGGPPHLDNLLRVLEETGGSVERIDSQMRLRRGEDIVDDIMDDEMDEEDEEDEEVDELEDELDDFEDGPEPYPGFDDEADLSNSPWGWDEAGTNNRIHSRNIPSWNFFPSHLPGRHGVIPVPGYRTHRTQMAPPRADDGTNPLLRRDDRPADQSGHPRGPNTEAFSDWVHAIDPSGQGRVLSVDSPVTFMNAILQEIARNGPDFGSVINRPDGIHVHMDRGAAFPGRLQNLFGLGRPQAVNTRSRDDPAQAVTFTISTTATRWQEESRLLFGAAFTDKAQRILKSLLKVLVPPAIEEEKLRQKQLQEERKRIEEERAERAKQERIAQEEAEKEQKRKEEEEAALRRQEEAERSIEEGAPQSLDTEPMEDVQPTAPSQEAGEPSAETAAPAAGPSEPAQRVHTTIRGRQLDITGMDIDPEYLEALPEEIREEVIMQQLAEQRSQAAAVPEGPSEINPEFLEALPPELREELLQQEAAERRRAERNNARRQAPAAGTPHAEDMDPASFIATLDPSLRQTVLADQPDEVLASLGPEFVSEARALSARRLPQLGELGMAETRPRSETSRHNQAAKKPQRRQVVQMLDKAGVATLLRLMFMPLQGNARHHLNDILHNVCQNRQNRCEVISLLLLILQDGSADISAVERSFAHLSLRAKTPTAQKTPVKRTLSIPTPGANSDVTPLIVIQQCLGALSFLTQYNPHISWFFLTEHEPASALKLKAIRKGKHKESRENKFALNSLLSLLDRKVILDSPNCMEQLLCLLTSITQPLTILLKKDKDKQEGDSKVEEPGNPPEATVSEAPRHEGDSGAADDSTAQPDTTMDDSATAAPEQENQENRAEPASSGDKHGPEDTAAGESKEKKPRMIEPPVVPEHNLRLLARIVAARECNGKTFRVTVSTIKNISSIPGAKEVIGKELASQGQVLSKAILIDLDELLPCILQAHSGTDVQGLALAKFSPASSDQAKLLRILTALDYIFDPSRIDKDKMSEAEVSEKEGVLKSLYESLTFGPLWTKLSDCLGAVQQKENMLNVATTLLPLIESLMVVCKHTTLKDVPTFPRHGREFSVSSPPPESGVEGLFFNFTEDHRKILNELVRQNPKLMSGSFCLLVKNPKVLEFDNKRNYFNRRLHSRGTEVRHPHPPLQLSVRRDQVFLDSFKSLYFKSADEMKYGKLSIRFHGEEGVDAGGVTREWFQVLARGMFNPDYALFIPVASDRTTFHPNRLSGVNQEHLMFFKFIGRIIGKALYEGRVLDCHFSRAVYKRILGKSVSIKDMETLDLDYYKSLLWMLENDITDILTENFSVEVEDFGETRVIDLVENGRNIPVTQDNKEEYVQRVVEHRLTGSVKEQLDNFLKGFHDIVAADLISIFNEQELELLISGLPEIDMDDWKSNTEYHNYSASSPQIQWFWRAVRSFDKEERAKLLQFVTGTSKVPLNGFRELEGMNGFSKFNIHRDYGNKDRLPSSHTCFNQLDLPEYESYEALRQCLYTAMTAGSEYFGFA